ncbi:MAG: hypothetical protein KC413_01680, partial [Anaerolineales bacterium]|nr:hypothetical protein [Anaerolineales bacterium]
MNTKRLTVVLGLLILALALVACGGSGDSTALQGEVDSLTQQLADANAALEEAKSMAADAAPAAPAAPEAVTFAGAGDTLQTIQDRGVLKCGGNANVPGFGYL